MSVIPREAETGVQDLHEQQSEFKANLGYSVGPCLKTKLSFKNGLGGT